MPATTLASLAGLFQTTVFKDLLAGEFTHKLALYNSILMKAPDSLISPNDRGTHVSFRKMNVLTGDMDQITNGLTTTINSVVPWMDTAAWVEREKAWGVEDIINTVTGDDLTQPIAAMIAEYLALQVHKSATATATGVFATALASTHIQDDGASLINTDGILAAKQLLGDNADKFTAFVCNSKVKTDAVKLLLTNKVQSTDSTITSGLVDEILGLRISTSDLLTKIGTQYPSYLGMMGSMIYQFRKRIRHNYTNANIVDIGIGDIELSRDSVTNGGQDRLILRTSYLTHIPGVQFDTTVTNNPTDAELATGATWTKTAPDDKLIPLVQYLSA
jgi:hypothetical protein